MSAIDVSTIAREVLRLMRTADAGTPAPSTAAPAAPASKKRMPRRKAGCEESKPVAASTTPKVVQRFGRALSRVCGGWFRTADAKPESDQIVAQHSFRAEDKGVCNVRVFKEGWAQIEFPSLSSYRQNAIAVRPEVWQCVMHVLRSKTCNEINQFISEHGLRERA
jgi:hypothetical protein